MNLQDLSLYFSGLNEAGYEFECQLIEGEVPVLQVVISGFEELPIYISSTDSQVLCIAYLWTEEEVIGSRKADMLEAMLDLNIPMPLSSFSRIKDRYVVFGALSVNSSFDDVLHEVITLGENSVEVIDLMSEFLK